ncbi:hypothetical protein Trydic_g382 [Trypoxylus dichotomus]
MEKNGKKKKPLRAYGRGYPTPKCKAERVYVQKHFDPCKKCRKPSIDDEFPDFPSVGDVESPERKTARRKSSQTTNSSDASLKKWICDGRRNICPIPSTECSGKVEMQKHLREKKRSSLSCNSSDCNVKKSVKNWNKPNTGKDRANDFTWKGTGLYYGLSHGRTSNQSDPVAPLGLNTKDTRSKRQEKSDLGLCGSACPLKNLEKCEGKESPTRAPSKRSMQDPYLKDLKRELSATKPTYSYDIKKTVSELKSEIARYRETLSRNVNILQERLGPNFFQRAVPLLRANDLPLRSPTSARYSQIRARGSVDAAVQQCNPPFEGTSGIGNKENVYVANSPKTCSDALVQTEFSVALIDSQIVRGETATSVTQIYKETAAIRTEASKEIKCGSPTQKCATNKFCAPCRQNTTIKPNTKQPSGSDSGDSLPSIEIVGKPTFTHDPSLMVTATHSRDAIADKCIPSICSAAFLNATTSSKYSSSFGGSTSKEPSRNLFAENISSEDPSCWSCKISQANGTKPESVGARKETTVVDTILEVSEEDSTNSTRPSGVKACGDSTADTEGGEYTEGIAFMPDDLESRDAG